MLWKLKLDQIKANNKIMIKKHFICWSDVIESTSVADIVGRRVAAQNIYYNSYPTLKSDKLNLLSMRSIFVPLLHSLSLMPVTW